MMSEYEDCFVFTCDGCGLTADFDRGGPGSFMACVGEIKSRGWRVVRAGDDWEHYCADPACRAAVAQRVVEASKRLLDRQPLKSVK
jgi:hypothetical protein